MTVAFQRMFGILERCNNNQVTPSLGKPHELSYRSNTISIGNGGERAYFSPKNHHKIVYKEKVKIGSKISYVVPCKM